MGPRPAVNALAGLLVVLTALLVAGQEHPMAAVASQGRNSQRCISFVP